MGKEIIMSGLSLSMATKGSDKSDTPRVLSFCRYINKGKRRRHTTKTKQKSDKATCRRLSFCRFWRQRRAACAWACGITGEVVRDTVVNVGLASLCFARGTNGKTDADSNQSSP